MEIKIEIKKNAKTFNIKVTLNECNELNVGELLNILNSAKKSTENSLADYLQKNKITITKKNCTQILESIKVSELAQL